MNDVKQLEQYVSHQGMKEIEHWVAKYPADQRQSAVMSTLMVLQEEHGYLTPELMDSAAEYLGMPPIAVYEVASFYTMYEKKPTAKHAINVCTNVSCQLNGSRDIVSALEQKLGIKVGEMTEDQRFQLRSVECLGACVNAPMMQIDKDYHENLTPEHLDAIIESYE